MQLPVPPPTPPTPPAPIPWCTTAAQHAARGRLAPYLQLLLELRDLLLRCCCLLLCNRCFLSCLCDVLAAGMLHHLRSAGRVH